MSEYDEDKLIEKVMKGGKEAILKDFPPAYAQLIEFCREFDPKKRIKITDAKKFLEDKKPDIISFKII